MCVTIEAMQILYEAIPDLMDNKEVISGVNTTWFSRLGYTHYTAKSCF